MKTWKKSSRERARQRKTTPAKRARRCAKEKYVRTRQSYLNLWKKITGEEDKKEPDPVKGLEQALSQE